MIFDHLQFMCGRGADQWAEQSKMIQMIQEVVSANEVASIAINHPNDNDKGSARRSISRDERVVQLRDLKGASTVRQDFANVWSIWRPRDKTRKKNEKENTTGYYGAGLTVLKNRSNRGEEESVKLKYHRQSMRFSA